VEPYLTGRDLPAHREPEARAPGGQVTLTGPDVPALRLCDLSERDAFRAAAFGPGLSPVLARSIRQGF
jgi:hypothetical protein